MMISGKIDFWERLVATYGDITIRELIDILSKDNNAQFNKIR